MDGKIKIFESVGHGGADPGAVSGRFVEKDMNLIYAKACNEVLVNYLELEPLLSRSDDSYLTVGELVAESNNWGSKLHIAFHLNAGGGDGCEIIHSMHSPEGARLAQSIAIEIADMGQNAHGEYLKTRASDQNSNRDYYAELRDTNAVAVILEPAFIDSPDVEFVDTVAELQALGKAVARGIIKYLKLNPREKVSPGPTELEVTDELAAIPVSKIYKPGDALTAVGSVDNYFLIDLNGQLCCVPKSLVKVK
jgi:N-acetylmuramoyl-L-alanine amidase